MCIHSRDGQETLKLETEMLASPAEMETGLVCLKTETTTLVKGIQWLTSIPKTISIHSDIIHNCDKYF